MLRPSRRNGHPGFRGVLVVATLLAIGSGCARVPPARQALLAKPNMVFADTAVFSDRATLPGQIEPGAAATGGAQAAGCTSCK